MSDLDFGRGLPVGRLRLHTFSGVGTSEAVIDACWQLRGRLIGLRADVLPGFDRAAFGDDLRRAWRLSVLRDPDGNVCGFNDLQTHCWPGELVLQGEYGFIAPAWRGHPALQLMLLRPVSEALLRHGGGRRAIYVGDVYPTGFRPFVRTLPQAALAGDAQLAPQLVDFAARHAETLYGARWEPEQTRVRLRTRPNAFEVHCAEDAALLARYERVNPQWREGYAALMMIPLTWSDMPRVFGRAFQRARRPRT